jgi:FMN phosphatase YigB (HAD superfamily)
MELNLKPQNLSQKLILVDCDGVILDWEYAFDVYMQQHGFNRVEGGELKYSIGARYDISNEQGKRLIKIFNESAHIGFLPPLRDAMYYVKKLAEEHGYRFHAITSLSQDPNACELRRMNLHKLFGKVAFEHFVFLDTGADKDAELESYRDTGCYWIEDKYENCLAGLKVGLKSILMEHGHSLDFNHPEIPKVKNWKEIYEIITGNKD